MSQLTEGKRHGTSCGLVPAITIGVEQDRIRHRAGECLCAAGPLRLHGHRKCCRNVLNSCCPQGPGCPGPAGKGRHGELWRTRASCLSLTPPPPHRDLQRFAGRPTDLAGRMSTCEWWVLVAISAVTLILYALLLLTLYIMLSRKIVAASRSCGEPASSSPAAQPQQPPAPAAGGEEAPRPSYAGSSDTSSETSEDSDSSPSCPQVPAAPPARRALAPKKTSITRPWSSRGKAAGRALPGTTRM
ncbi:regulator of hemoglobinization and erythroid cell expansion protein isoform X3 [Strix aluco]|uniref:regulator of hemoglobinization and erythroid cell expansion protein isoform X3 n=1 Tax=Strix aluco TaxID=111821 RepID=UPI003DA5D07A